MLDKTKLARKLISLILLIMVLYGIFFFIPAWTFNY